VRAFRRRRHRNPPEVTRRSADGRPHCRRGGGVPAG
jgi:hypothetical protein